MAGLGALSPLRPRRTRLRSIPYRAEIGRSGWKPIVASLGRSSRAATCGSLRVSRYDRTGRPVPTRSAMNATPDSTLASPEQRIADLERQLAEREAELAEAKRNLNETTTERDEALAQQTATAEVLQARL